MIPGFGLTLGYTILYLSLVVLVPLSALFLKTAAAPYHIAPITARERFGDIVEGAKPVFYARALASRCTVSRKRSGATHGNGWNDREGVRKQTAQRAA